MKKLLPLILLLLSALISRAQSTEMQTADAYFAKKSYANASGYYNRVITADTANVKALRRMGYCIMNLPRQELNATKYFYRALAIDPKDSASAYYLGIIYMDAAKDESEQNAKADYKARAAKYLNLAVSCGSEDAKSAIKDLNGI